MESGSSTGASFNSQFTYIGVPFRVSRSQLEDVYINMALRNGVDPPKFGIHQVHDSTPSEGNIVVDVREPYENISSSTGLKHVLHFDPPLDLDVHSKYILRIEHPQAATNTVYHFDNGDVTFLYAPGAGVFYRQIGAGKSTVTGTIQLRSNTLATTHIIGRNLTSTANQRKEMLYQAQDVINVAEMTVLQLGLLDAAGRTERKFSPLTTSMTTDVPPLGEQVRVIDVHNGLDTYLDIMGYTVSGAVAEQSNLAPVDMHWTLETRL